MKTETFLYSWDAFSWATPLHDNSYTVPGSENEKVLHLNRRGQIAQFWCASSAVPVPSRYDLQMKKAASHYEKSGYM